MIDTPKAILILAASIIVGAVILADTQRHQYIVMDNGTIVHIDRKNGLTAIQTPTGREILKRDLSSGTYTRNRIIRPEDVALEARMREKQAIEEFKRLGKEIEEDLKRAEKAFEQQMEQRTK